MPRRSSVPLTRENKSNEADRVVHTDRVRVNVVKVFELPLGTGSKFVLPSLSLLVLHATNMLALDLVFRNKRNLMTDLDLTLLPTRRLKIALADPLRDPPPELPALPLVHIIDCRDGDFLLRALHIRERLATAKILAREVPQALKRALRIVRARRRQHGLELVGFAAEVSFAFVLDLSLQYVTRLPWNEKRSERVLDVR